MGPLSPGFTCHQSPTALFSAAYSEFSLSSALHDFPLSQPCFMSTHVWRSAYFALLYSQAKAEEKKFLKDVCKFVCLYTYTLAHLGRALRWRQNHVWTFQSHSCSPLTLPRYLTHLLLSHHWHTISGKDPEVLSRLMGIKVLPKWWNTHSGICKGSMYHPPPHLFDGGMGGGPFCCP